MDVVEIPHNKLAVGGIFVVAAGALVGLAIWLSPGQTAPAGPEITPAAGEVSTSVVSQATSTGSVTVSADTVVSQPAANGAATTTKPGQKAPAQVQATDEPAPVTTTASAAPIATTTGVPTTTPPQTVAPAREPWCYDPNGQRWYSGAGEGCSESSPHFVEYR